MKILVLGKGGKEHAIVWKLSRSKHVTKVYCCPGNPGIAEIAECVDVSPGDFSALIDFVKYEWIDLTIVGSEELLSKGIVNSFEREGCKILGPDRAVSKFGSGRVIAKNLMRTYRIPTADYKVFTSYLHAQDYIRLKGAPVVIKTDVHSDSDGIFVANTFEEAIDILRRIMKDKIFGDIGKQVIIEENLKGEIVSFVFLVDGKTFAPLTNLSVSGIISSINPEAEAKGAFSPVAVVSKKIETFIAEKIAQPLLKALRTEGLTYKGFLIMDLKVYEDRAHIFDISCSFGNLAAQTILPRLKTDFMDILLNVLEEKASHIDIEWKEGSSVCISLLSKQHGEEFRKGTIITGLEKIRSMEDIYVFHEGTSHHNNDIVVSGRRVLSLTATGSDMEDAKTKVFRAVGKIHFEGMYYEKI